MILFKELSNKSNCFWLLILVLPLFSEGVIYQESLIIEDLTLLFGDEDCIEGSLSVTESGHPVIKSSGYVSSPVPTVKTKEKNETVNEKSAMSFLYELAEFNKIKMQFILTDEKGPAHKKQFVVSLKLGNEEYTGEGGSIKKAQREASKLALNSTLYDHPPKRMKNNISVEKRKSPVQKLDDWAIKHNNALVKYSFSEQSQLVGNGQHANYYHSGMYSKAQNTYKATVTIANHVFSGEGWSLDIAKENAATNALQSLQNVDGFCMLSDKEKSFFNKVFESNFDSDNPISLVHEFGKLSNMPVFFDLYSEEGPAHIKKFVFRCNVGNGFESFGEGSSKKSAKREAAENMIQVLKRHASFNKVSCEEELKKSKPKKKKPRNLIKSVVRSYSEDEEERANNGEYIPEELDPVSKLFQIQQAKHEMLPVFTQLEKKNNEFSMEVTVNDLTAIGTGSSKKAAKKNAAQSLLEKMGYSNSNKKDQKFSEKKKKDFSEETTGKKLIAPGMNLNTNKHHEFESEKEHVKSKSANNNEKTHKLKDNLGNKPQSKNSLSIEDQSNLKSKKSESQRRSDLQSKLELNKLSQQMGFKFQFSDFPKANSSGFISLISLTTDPPQVCYGVGETSDRARDRAAFSALGSLYKAQLNHISRILQEENIESPVKSDITFIEEDNVVRSSFVSETE